MSRLKIFLAKLFMIALAAVAFSSGATEAKADPAADARESALTDGHKVVNIVDDFLAFWKYAEGQNSTYQRWLWQRIVENKHRDYFERAIYRGADAHERWTLLNEFFIRVPSQIREIKAFNKRAKEEVLDSLRLFKLYFPEYRQKTDIYIGLSLYQFDGSIRPLQNYQGVPDTLCLGAELLAEYTPTQRQIALSHEFFHLYHFGFLFDQPEPAELLTAHIPLMVEGLAVAASEIMYPYQPPGDYLHYTREELAAQEPEVALNGQKYLWMMQDGAPPEQYEQWFTHSATAGVPARGGYLLGYEVAKRLVPLYSFADLVRLTPVQLREHAEEQLSSIVGDQMIMLVAETSRSQR